MNRITLLISLFSATVGFSQSYAPPANQAGTTAIHKDSSVFVAWATGIDLKRGFLDIADTNFMISGSNKVSYGAPSEALYQAQGSSATIVSLGDGGVATLTFQRPIFNGEGPDFAVFENSFLPDFLELAFVEVSSDGEHFFRFPAHSENQFAVQIATYGTMDCRFIHNLAGKYEQGYGTPFDLSDLPVDALLDVDAITHVRIIDVVGTIDPTLASLDRFGNPINDPYPTAFASGGFDLDGVGVIHQKTVGLPEITANYKVYPNPTAGLLTLDFPIASDVRIIDFSGKVVAFFPAVEYQQLNLVEFQKGVYFAEITNASGKFTQKLILR